MRECAYYFKRGGFGSDTLQVKYSTYHLKNKPSGLCTMQLYVDFQGAVWNDTVQDVLSETDLLAADFGDIEDRLPPMALPSFMSFPETAKDVSEIVKFANKHGLKVSVKNSGHSYTAGSTSAGSLQINLREFPQYSFAHVTECDEGAEYTPLSGPDGACKLALDRGKTAYARVGGGQGNDDIYRSVMDYNFMEPRERHYNVLGGAEGMIGGGGGFMMGGGLGRGEERLYGNGADQVLELEMILPDGQHVKFSPTEWEQVEGFEYPQTTKVEGKCNANIDHDEPKWEWTDCPDGRPFANVTFEDLWFAVRGGGGGAWGVVLSSMQQLHELIPQFSLATVQVDPDEDILQKTCKELEDDPDCPALFNMLNYMWLDFLIDLLWNADNEIGADEELRLHCGFTGRAPLNPITSYGGELKCHGHGIQGKFQEAWKTSVSKSKYLLDGYGEEAVCNLQNRVYMEGGPYDKWHRNGLSDSVRSPSYSPIGHYQDSSGPEGAYRSFFFWSGTLIPGSLLATKSDKVFETLLFLGYLNAGVHTLPFASRNDGITPLPQVYHSGGIQTYVGPFLALFSLAQSPNSPQNLCDNLREEALVSSMEKELGEYQTWILSHLGYDGGDNFPGYTEYNHLFASYGGVLRSDPTKPCPLMSTREEKRRLCLSAQETVWGTENFRRLTAIKGGIDPENLFDVYFGIGNDERAGPASYYCARTVDPTAPPLPDPEYSAPSQSPRECPKSGDAADPGDADSGASPTPDPDAEPGASPPPDSNTVDAQPTPDSTADDAEPTAAPLSAGMSLASAWRVYAFVAGLIGFDQVMLHLV